MPSFLQLKDTLIKLRGINVGNAALDVPFRTFYFMKGK